MLRQGPRSGVEAERVQRGEADLARRIPRADLEVTVEDLITGSDRVAARLQWTGVRHDGNVTRQTLEIIQIEGGMAVEHWGGRS